MSTRLYGSLARIADFRNSNFDVTPLLRPDWATGDYIETEVVGTPTPLYRIEDRSGHMVRVEPGDWVVGALGDRKATLEGVGSWRDISPDGRMHALTSAGLLGLYTSLSQLLPPPLELEYRGHLCRRGRKLRMSDFAMRSDTHAFNVPTVLLVGTSMSAGKTTAGRRVCKELDRAGLFVVGAKLTGAGRYRDILSFLKTGATRVFDFVDAGLPSTAVPEDEFRAAIRPLLGHIDGLSPDFLVAEAGASPLEPYNGAAIIDELGHAIVCTILCASDPYAVVGVEKAFGLKPDLVTGPATQTAAAVELVQRLSGVRGINVIDPAAKEAFRRSLVRRLGLQPGDHSASVISSAPKR
ncbi:MAG: NAD-dependent epimerase/dehydratase family protein [Proteobacteria bacterium]|nr:NAD-dependent epimerase/dehydratase family protein [Pseudomonadota bacterium]